VSLFLSPGPVRAWVAPADTLIQGPVNAVVLNVVSGNGLRVLANPWLNVRIDILVRLAGISVPLPRLRCPREEELARKAENHLATLIPYPAVELIDVSYDSTPGWVIATVVNAEHQDLSAEMLKAGLAVADPGAEPWCEEAWADSPP